ncbi:MAG: HlyD family efflux transporter periplasmic adaptor subunit [Acidobacteriota bacterium]
MATPFPRTLRSLQAERADGRPLAIAACFLLLATWTAWFLNARIPVLKTSHSASLALSDHATAVASPVQGRISALHAKVGEPVSAGDVLVELDSPELLAQLEEARSRAAMLTAHVAALDEQLAAEDRALSEFQVSTGAIRAEERSRQAGAELEAEAARRELARLSRLAARSLISENELADARSRSEVADTTVETLRLAVARREREQATTARDRETRLAALRADAERLRGEVTVANATRRRLEVERERHLLRAPVDGTIGELAALAVGAVVEEGQPIATLTREGPVQVTAVFPATTSLGHLHAGQPARVRLHGFTWSQHGSLQARVVRVGTQPREQLLQVVLEVTGTVPPTLPLTHGLAGVVEVEVERISPATMVLRAAGDTLTPRGSDEPSATLGG